MATGQFKQAETDFNESLSQSMRNSVFAKEAAEKAKVEARNLQNNLLAAGEKLNQQGQVDALVGQTKQQFANDPYAAADSFTKKVIPAAMETLRAQYPDPYTQKAMLPQFSAMLEAGRAELQAWAPRQVNAQIEAKLKGVPIEVSNAVGGIDASQPVAQQLADFRKIVANGAASYAELRRQSSQLPGKAAEIDAAAGSLHQLVSKQFVQNGISQIADDETGLAQAQSWRRLIENPEANHLALGGDDKATLLGQLKKQQTESLQAQIGGIQSDNQIALNGIKVQQIYLARNFNNPKVRDQIMNGLHQQLTDLLTQQKQLEAQKAAAGSPQDAIRKQKLVSIGQQIGQLLGGENQQLKEQNSYDALQRQLTSFAHGLTRFAESQVTFQQGQLRFTQGQEDRAKREGDTEANQAFNQQMEQLHGKAIQIMGMPLGPDRLKAAQGHAQEMMSAADAALKTGAIKRAEQYEAISKQATDLIRLSEYKMSGLPWDRKAVPLQQSKDRIKAAVDAAQKTALVSAAAQKDLDTVQTMVKMVPTWAKNPGEAAAVQKYFYAHGPGMINRARQAGYTDAMIEKELPNRVSAALIKYRKGELH